MYILTNTILQFKENRTKLTTLTGYFVFDLEFIHECLGGGE